MQSDEVGLRQHFVQGHHGHSHAGREVRGDERIVRDQVHAEAGRPARHLGADPAQPDNAQRLVAHLDAHEGGALPLPFLHGGIGLRDVAGQGQHQGDSVLGGGDRVANGRVDHGDAGAGGRVQINVIHADAGPGDDFKIASGGDHRLGDLGLAAHH